MAKLMEVFTVLIKVGMYSLFLVPIDAKSGADSSRLKNEVNSLCEVYNADNWHDYDGPKTLISLHQEVAIRAHKVGNSKDYRIILQKAATTKPGNLYNEVKTDIEKAIKEEWDCEDMRKFYSALANQGKSTQNISTAVIYIDAFGYFRSTNSSKRYDTAFDLLAALPLSPEQHIKIELESSREAPKEAESLKQLLQQLQDQGFTRVEIVEAVSQ